jgi:hypothetical protein
VLLPVFAEKTVIRLRFTANHETSDRLICIDCDLKACDLCRGELQVVSTAYRAGNEKRAPIADTRDQ